MERNELFVTLSVLGTAFDAFRKPEEADAADEDVVEMKIPVDIIDNLTDSTYGAYVCMCELRNQSLYLVLQFCSST